MNISRSNVTRRLEAKGKHLRGKAKELLGKSSGDRSLEVKGKAEQAKAAVHDVAAKASSTASKALHRIKESAPRP